MKYESKAAKRANKYRNSRKYMAQMRKDLQPLVDEANRLYNQLKAVGATSDDNAAIAEAEYSLTKSKERTSTDMFSVDDKHHFRDIRREAARLEKFLSSAQSSVSVYQYEKPAIEAMNKYNITFKNQHERFLQTGHRFTGVDQERMKFAAKIYRRLEESHANIYGAGGYGSDPLINLIYDAVERYDPYMSEDAMDDLEFEVLNMGHEVLNEHQRLIDLGFISTSLNNNIDIGVVSNIKKSMSTEDYFENNPFLKDNITQRG